MRALIGAPRGIKTSNEFQIHFIFGLPKSSFTEDFVSFISRKLIKSSKFYFTSLEGLYRVKNSQTFSNASNNKFTISDDSIFMYNELKKYKPYGFYKRTSSSTFLEADDTFTKIECKRKSYTRKTRSKGFVMIIGFYIALLIFAFVLVVFGLVFTEEKSSKVFLSENLSWVRILHIAFVCLGVFTGLVMIVFSLLLFLYTKISRLSRHNTAFILLSIPLFTILVIVLLSLLYQLYLLVNDGENESAFSSYDTVYYLSHFNCDSQVIRI